MATTTLIPNGDGSAGGITIVGASTMWEAIDEDPVSHDSDTTYIRGPGAGSTSGFVLLSDTPADFDPANITSITLDFVGRRVNTTTIHLHAQVFKSDETTALTDEGSLSNVGTTYTRQQFAATQQGSPSKADWDGARLRIRQEFGSGSNPHGRITAARVIIEYTTGGPAVHEGAVTIAGAGALAGAGLGIFHGAVSVAGLGGVAGAAGLGIFHGGVTIVGSGSMAGAGSGIFHGQVVIPGVGAVAADGELAPPGPQVHAGQVVIVGQGAVIPAGDTFHEVIIHNGQVTIVGEFSLLGIPFRHVDVAVMRPDGVLVPAPRDLRHKR